MDTADRLFWRWFVEFMLLSIGLTIGGLALIWPWFIASRGLEGQLASLGIWLAATVVSLVVSCYRLDRRVDRWLARAGRSRGYGEAW